MKPNGVLSNRICLIFIILNLTLYLSAQVNIDFENQLFLEWNSNDILHWEITDKEAINGRLSLHHAYDNPSSGNDYIFRKLNEPIDCYDTIIWQFTIRHSYLPSTSNRWLFYLLSENSVPQSNSIAIGVNASGSDDFLKLYFFNDEQITIILNTTLNWEKTIADSVALVKVIRFPDSKWQIYAGTKYSKKLILVGEANYAQLPLFNFFGIQYFYSSAQDRKLWIDDISIKAGIIQNPTFKLDSFWFSSNNQLCLRFNYSIKSENLNNASFKFSIPIEIKSLSPSSNNIYISFAEQFPVNQSVQLKISNIFSTYNIQISDTTIHLFYVKPEPFDILITEIMPDPTPQVHLPEYEYLELYNRSTKLFNIKNWKIISGSYSTILPNITLPPDSFLIVTYKNASRMFDKFGKVCYCLSNSSFLNNEKSNVLLLDSSGQIISMVSYNNTWHTSKYKQDGGWSLEMIDFSNPCQGYGNWTSSVSSDGGTPGKPNSIVQNIQDTIKPEVTQLAIHSDSSIVVIFSENLHPLSSFNHQYFEISPNIGNPEKIEYFNNQFNHLILHFSQPFIAGINYRLFINDSVSDCVGNKISSKDIEFSYPERIDSADIVINEILPDPLENGVCFIELFNCTQKALNLGDIIIALIDGTTKNILSYIEIVPSGVLIFPENYLAITSSYEKLSKNYKLPSRWNIYELKKLFDFPNTDGWIALIRKWDGKIIDLIHYNEAMHVPFLATTKGVSLERVNPFKSGIIPENWHSAAQSVGFATPGYKNSQQIIFNPSKTNHTIQLYPETFSPNNDGIDDLLTIEVKITEPSAIIDLYIFSSNGELIRKLASNQYIGPYEQFYWDGTKNENTCVPSGIYIIYAKIFTVRSVIGEYRKTCVLIK